MERKAFVLLSGGLDSTTCLYKAIYDYCPQDIAHAYGDKGILAQLLIEPIEKEIEWVEAVSVDYGQRHTKEIEYARRTCDRLGIKHTILDVGKLLSGASVMLSKESLGSVAVPDISYADIKGVSPTYVPFRNGLMLSAITAHAQKYVNAEISQFAKISYENQLKEGMVYEGQEKDWVDFATKQAKDLCGVYFGAHAEDAFNWAYPDCTPEWIGSMANAIYVGTYFAVRLHTPLEWLNKSEVVKLGSKLGVPFEDTWSCYKGEELHCGQCPTCRSRKEAFQLAGVEDPTKYAS